MVLRGVPYRIAKDAWWLDDTEPPKGLRAGPALIAALVSADVLLWGLHPGFGLMVWFLVLAVCIALTIGKWTPRRRGVAAMAVLLLAILPLAEVVQFGTVVIAAAGLAVFGIMLAADRFDGGLLWRAVTRLPAYGLAQTLRDAFALRVPVPSRGGVRGALFDWALPVIVGSVFLLLFAAANPLLDQWLLAISHLDVAFLPRWERVFFWGMIAVAVWPLLRLKPLLPALTKARRGRARRLRSGFVNERSVRRALVVFNLIFLVQTTLDLGYLWGGVALPDGMTYAQYAHRGAYPLIVVALLAGMFAIAAQPYLGSGKALRSLLYLWIAQTVVLVISSILRLDLYVEVYGLTRLRVAAFVWMIVVALGLILILLQLAQRRSVGWFLGRAASVGILAIYLCNLVNIDGIIARHNLADDRDNDFYLCGLSEGVVPALRAHEIATGEQICPRYGPALSVRQDWREWGYRNMRLHRSLAAMELEQ